MRNRLKWFALLGLLLFLEVTVAPNINAGVEKESNEITLKYCYRDNCYQSKVILSKQQLTMIDNVFNNLYMKMRTVNTTEASLKIMNSALDELHAIGLIDEKSTCIVKQKITEIYSRSNDKTIPEFLKTQASANNTNYLCLLAGKTTNTFNSGPGTRAKLCTFNRSCTFIQGFALLFYNLRREGF